MQEEIESYLNFLKLVCPKLTRDDLLWHSKDLSIKDYKKRDIFIEAGEYQKNIGFVTSGLIRSYYVDREGNEVTQQFIGEGKFASHYAMLLANQPSRFNYQCLEDTTIVVIPFQCILEAYEYAHSFERFGRLIAEKICQEHHIRIESFLFDTAEERYLNFTRDFASLSNRISVTHLCSYLGMERQTLTRIRKKLAQK